MIRTRVGYAGGQKNSPTYSDLGDHTEAVQVDYDPQRISYSQLLDIFWNSHQPTQRTWSRQYMNTIFYHNEHQRQVAMDSKARIERKIGQKVKTEVIPVKSFTMAEDYHQKYLLKRHRDLKNELSRVYPDHLNFVNSTAASRLNGYVGGNGSKTQLLQEIDSLGLSDQGKKELIEIVQR